MKHSTIGLILPSPLLSIGIEQTFIHLKDISLRIEKYNIDDYIRRMVHVIPLIMIVDMSVVSVNDIEIMRQNGVKSIIGVSINQYPPAIRKFYDDIISIYDNTDLLLNTLKKYVSLDTDIPQKELSPREKEVVIGIVKGMSNKEIANLINVSVNTVMTHRRNISSKLQIHSPAGLTIYAIVSNLVTMEEIKSTLPEQI